MNIGIIGLGVVGTACKNGFEKVGHTVRAKIQKNKVGAPFRQAEYKVEYEKGIVSQGEELFDLAVKYGLIERPNNQSYMVYGEKVRGRDAALACFSQNNASLEEYDLKIRDMYLSGGPPGEAGSEKEEANPLIGKME